MPYTDRYATTEPTRADIDARPGLTLVEFGAPWCPHCIGAQAAIEQAVARLPDAGHVKIEDGRGRPLGRSFRVKLWPTVIAMRDGIEVARVVRPRSIDDLAPLLAAA
jgi:thioredoxin 1